MSTPKSNAEPVDAKHVHVSMAGCMLFGVLVLVNNIKWYNYEIIIYSCAAYTIIIIIQEIIEFA